MFRWLDKLGITSKLGVDLVFRQGFFEHAYGLVDGNFSPRPVWSMCSVQFKFCITLDE